jgi:hypothetical protein
VRSSVIPIPEVPGVLSANRNYPPGRIVDILDICRSVPLRTRFPGEVGFPAQCQGLKEAVLRRTLLSRGVTVSRDARSDEDEDRAQSMRRNWAELQEQCLRDELKILLMTEARRYEDEQFEAALDDVEGGVGAKVHR